MIESWKEDKLLTGFSNHFMNEANSTLPYFPPLMYILVWHLLPLWNDSVQAFE